MSGLLLNSGFQILMYHSISDNPKDPHAIHPDLFASQMEKLSSEKVKVVSLLVAVNGLPALPEASRTVALTFDDGYCDFLLNAAPILRTYGFPATLFISTGVVGGTAKWDSHDKSKKLMDWDELKEVDLNGFDIASHTVSHPRLTECDEQSLEYELRSSLEVLHERFDRAVPLLSYPGGFYGRREMVAAKETGYSAAVGVASRFRNYPWTNPFCLRRRRWPE